jgi:IclR family KDG regulon transcriptional repressor
VETKATSRQPRKTLPAASPAHEKYMVPVVQGTFHILEELARAGPLSLNEVTKRTALSKSTVFRILTTLCGLGYVVRDNSRSYYISHIMEDLVRTEALTETMRRKALPHMVELRNLYGETVNLGQLRLDKVMYLEVVPSEYALRLHERQGATVAIHASALGKVILAFSEESFVSGLLPAELPAFTASTITDPASLIRQLKRIRRTGYAVDKGEASPLASCVAAPILDGQQRAIAAISISGPASRFNPIKTPAVIKSLLKAAADISKQIQSRDR